METRPVKLTRARFWRVACRYISAPAPTSIPSLFAQHKPLSGQQVLELLQEREVSALHSAPGLWPDAAQRRMVTPSDLHEFVWLESFTMHIGLSVVQQLSSLVHRRRSSSAQPWPWRVCASDCVTHLLSKPFSDGHLFEPAPEHVTVFGAVTVHSALETDIVCSLKNVRTYLPGALMRMSGSAGAAHLQ